MCFFLFITNSSQDTHHRESIWTGDNSEVLQTASGAVWRVAPENQTASKQQTSTTLSGQSKWLVRLGKTQSRWPILWGQDQDWRISEQSVLCWLVPADCFWENDSSVPNDDNIVHTGQGSLTPMYILSSGLSFEYLVFYEFSTNKAI